MFLSVAKSGSWQIKPSKNYNADDNLAYAFSEAKLPALSGKKWCPQNLVNMVWATGKWTKDIKVLGKIHVKIDQYVKFLDKSSLTQSGVP